MTRNEACVLTALRELHRGREGETVRTAAIRERCLDVYRIGYESVTRALKSLVAQGLVEKPKRGFYRPAGEA